MERAGPPNGGDALYILVGCSYNFPSVCCEDRVLESYWPESIFYFEEAFSKHWCGWPDDGLSDNNKTTWSTAVSQVELFGGERGMEDDTDRQIERLDSLQNDSKMKVRYLRLQAHLIL